MFDRTPDPRIPERTLFPLGRIVVTTRALARIEREGIDPFELLKRHQRGDFGDLDPQAIRANAEALHEGNRIFSSYAIGGDQKLSLITEADRSATTILTSGEN